MNEEDLRRLAEGFERYNAGDIEAVIALAAPDIHAHIPMPMANSGDYHGHDEFRVMLERWNEAWGEYRQEILQVDDCGPGRVVVSTRFTARGAGSGAAVEEMQAYFIEVRGALMTKWRLFNTREAAMQHAATL